MQSGHRCRAGHEADATGARARNTPVCGGGVCPPVDQQTANAEVAIKSGEKERGPIAADNIKDCLVTTMHRNACQQHVPFALGIDVGAAVKQQLADACVAGSSGEVKRGLVPASEVSNETRRPTDWGE